MCCIDDCSLTVTRVHNITVLGGDRWSTYSAFSDGLSAAKVTSLIQSLSEAGQWLFKASLVSVIALQTRSFFVDSEFIEEEGVSKLAFLRRVIRRTATLNEFLRQLCILLALSTTWRQVTFHSLLVLVSFSPTLFTRVLRHCIIGRGVVLRPT